MLDTVLLHSARPELLRRAADRLKLPPGGRVLLTCRPLTAAEAAQLADWYVIELPTERNRWDTGLGKSFWTTVGKPRRLVAPHAGIGYPGLEFRNVLRFLAIQRGLEKIVLDREGREYRVSWGSIFLAGTLGQICHRQLAMLMFSLFLGVMRLADGHKPAPGAEKA